MPAELFPYQHLLVRQTPFLRHSTVQNSPHLHPHHSHKQTAKCFLGMQVPTALPTARILQALQQLDGIAASAAWERQPVIVH